MLFFRNEHRGFEASYRRCNGANLLLVNCSSRHGMLEKPRWSSNGQLVPSLDQHLKRLNRSNSSCVCWGLRIVNRTRNNIDWRSMGPLSSTQFVACRLIKQIVLEENHRRNPSHGVTQQVLGP